MSETQNSNTPPFMLRISITGLCLFVPDADEKKMHLLMPPTTGSHLHVPRLLVDTAFLRPDSRRHDGFFAHFPLDDRAIELPLAGGVGTADTVIAEHHHIGSLEDVVVEKVKKNRLGAKPPKDKVASRVTLAAGGLEPATEAVLWSVRKAAGGSKKECMTWRANWTAKNIQMESLVVRLQSLVGAAAIDLPPLYPMARDGGIIDLKVYHVPPHELPPVKDEPCVKGVVSKHFQHYSGVFDGSKVPPARVVDCDCGDRKRTVSSGRVQPLTKEIGSFFTCILATAPLEETKE